MPKNIKVLKVKFHQVTLDEATLIALNLIHKKGKNYICTPNPEMLLEADKNPKFLKILNQSTLNVADGIGILWAAKYLDEIESKSPSKKFLNWTKNLFKIPFAAKSLREILPERVSGIDLMTEICRHAGKNKLKIFLLGAKEGIAAKASKKLEKKFPNIKIVGTSSEEEIEKINKSKAEIIFVAFGAPSQEIWISENLHRMPTIKLAMGVGGSFDFLAGKRHRAPKYLQKIGLEWLFRLIQEPKRIKRIYNATVKFPIKVLKESLKK